MGMTRPFAQSLLPTSLSCTFSARFVVRIQTRGGASPARRERGSAPGYSVQALRAKGTRLRDLTQHQLDIIVEKINNTPRKRLGYRTPNEVFQLQREKLRVALGA